MSGALREIAASFGIKFDDSELKRGMESVGGAVRAVQGLAAAFAGNKVVQAVRHFAEDYRAAANEVETAALAMRIGTTEFQSLRHAGMQAGLSAQQATAAFAAFHRNIRAGAVGALGVQTRDAAGHLRSAADVADDVAARFDRIASPARRARLATQLFGEAGTRMLTILRSGAGGLAEFRRELAEDGGGISPEGIEVARGYERAMNRWHVATDAVRSELAVGLLPVLTWFADKTRAVSTFMAGLFRHTHGVRNALMVLGVAGAAAAVPLLVAWAPAIATFALAAAAIAAVVLVVDDLVTMFRGGHSVIGSFIDELWGVGSAKEVVDYLTDAWHGLAQAITEVRDVLRPVVNAVGGALEQVADFATGRQSHSGASDQLDREIAAQNARMRQRRGIRRANETARAEADTLARVRPGSALADAPTVSGTISLATTPASLPVSRAARSTVVHHSSPATFHINGARDPRAVANEVATILERRRRDELDAAHPLAPRE